ncbi:uncharacterized protein LOC112142995 [Oryzias melastigma]|uniref:uncharacterized protein LOC112142995 n=1 Tax=Oryzias melastigma TaxID=30732 RepID=UPI000CF81BDF|nr:uncharacterized protein LOC112142995 [Oryzias melastigma]
MDGILLLFSADVRQLLQHLEFLERFINSEDPGPECEQELSCSPPEPPLSLRRWWPFAIRTFSFQKPLRTWRWSPEGLQGWHSTEFFLKAAGAIDGRHIRIKPPGDPGIIPKALSIIERAFGIMKTRFRGIFLHVLEVHHTFVPHGSELTHSSILYSLEYISINLYISWCPFNWTQLLDITSSPVLILRKACSSSHRQFGPSVASDLLCSPHSISLPLCLDHHPPFQICSSAPQ